MSYYVMGGMALIFSLIYFFKDKIEKKWGYEAKFLNHNQEELGELEIELSYNPRLDQRAMIKYEFSLIHPAIEARELVDIYIDKTKVISFRSQNNGEISIYAVKEENSLKQPRSGQTCAVAIKGKIISKTSLKRH